MTAVDVGSHHGPQHVPGSLRAWADRLTRPATTRTTPIAVRVVTWALATLAGLALWLVIFGLFLSGLAEAHQQHDLYDNFRAALASGTVPVQGPIAEGQPVAMLTSSAGGLDNIVVVEGTSSTALRAGPGHLPATPLPGQAGVSVIMGRSSSYGAPFGSITHLRPGDKVVAVSGLGTFTYSVMDVRRPGTPEPTQLPPSGGVLTLVTSEGNGWRSGWAPSHEVFVDMALVGQPASSGLISGIPRTSDLPMHSDTRGMYPLILWLQLLLAAVIVAAWARVRWGRWQTWLVFVPIALTALWGASENFWLLLPNML